MNRRHEAVIDAAVPALVGAVIVIGEILHGGRSTQPAAVGLGLAAALALWARRRAPGLTLAITGVLVALLLHVDRAAGTVAVLAPAVALYSLALTRSRRAQVLAGLAAVGAVLVADLLHSGRPGMVQTLGHVLLVAIPLLAAEQVRTHRSYLTVLTDRLKLAEAAREREAERRAEQERLRIARELHDVVAHTLTEINVQAGAAAERAEPSDARDALERIEDASRGAIGELRTILGVLRGSEPREAPLAPAVGIDGISELVRRTRQTGLDARLEVSGRPPDRMSDVTSLAAYRIVQESLTNARRHAPGTQALVGLRFGEAEVSVCVENARAAGSSRNGSARGVGIAGMRERATALGGAFEAGPVAGRFRVRAELPYQPSA